MANPVSRGKILGVFEKECLHIQFDKHLLAKVVMMQEAFVSKRKEHTEFFGGTLTGVHVVRWTDNESDALFDDILDVDQSLIERDLLNLRDEHGTPVINPEHRRGSDVFNIASIYAIHKFHTSPHLTDEQRNLGKVRICAYLIYKFFTSLLYHYFPYPADREIAAATYAELSKKFSLKEYGSWGETILALAETMAGNNSAHIRVIENMDFDYDVERMINDVQSRIKDMLKNIWAVFSRVHSNGGRIGTSSTFSEIEGEIELKDRTSTTAKYIRYLKNIVGDKDTFVKTELVDLVASMMSTAPKKAFMQTLSWTSNNYLHASDGKIDEAIDIVMEHAIDYISSYREIQHTDVGAMLVKLRGTYTSSKSTDVRLMTARRLVEELVRRATGSKNDNAVAAVRTAWMLYVVARAYTMRYYASQQA